MGEYQDKYHAMLKEQPFRLRIPYDFLSYVKFHLNFPITDNTCLLSFSNFMLFTFPTLRNFLQPHRAFTRSKHLATYLNGAHLLNTPVHQFRSHAATPNTAPLFPPPPHPPPPRPSHTNHQHPHPPHTIPTPQQEQALRPNKRALRLDRLLPQRQFNVHRHPHWQAPRAQ